MTIALSILIFLLAVLGVIGSFLPILPGPIISFIAYLFIHLFGISEVSSESLWTIALISLLLTLLDFYLPSFLVKLGRGSSYATTGAGIGAVLGLFLGPFGIILGPLFGAFIGEIINGTKPILAVRIAVYAFMGFLSGVFLKFLFSFYVLFHVIRLLF